MLLHQVLPMGSWKPRRKRNMLTNKTRKGLSWAASIALATASFVGISAPANAAIGVVEPKGGTSTTFVAGDTFELRLNGTYASSTSVSWEVTVPAGKEAGYGIQSENTTETAYSTASGKVYIAFNGAGTAAGNTLKIKQADTTSATTVTVRAYIDANGVTGWQSGEETSNTVDVSFIKLADLAPTITITSPVEGDVSVSAKVTFNVNNEQLEHTSISAKVAYGDGAAGIGASSATSVSAHLVEDFATSTPYFNVGFNVEALIKDKAVAVTVAYRTVELGAAATTATIAARKTGSSTMSSVVSPNALSSGATGAADSRLNSAFAVELLAVDTSTVDASTASPVAGAKVSVKIETSATHSTTTVQTLKVNGTSYTDKAKLPGATGVDQLALTTDAAGKVTINLETAAYVAGDTITVTAKVENRAAQTFVFTQRAAAYSAFVDNTDNGFNAVAGSTNNVVVLVRDQFKVAPADGKYQARAAWASSTRTSAKAATDASNTFANVSGGSATLAIKDNGSGAGTETYNIKLATLATDGSSTEATFLALPIKYTAAAETPGTVTITGTGVAQNSTTKVYTLTTTAASISGKVFAAHDSRKSTVASPEVVLSNALTISGVVSTLATATAAASPIGGAEVTIAGSGLLFSSAVSSSSRVYGVDSLTVKADKDGAYTFRIWSNKSGKQTVTVKSGSVTSTLVIDTYAKVDAFTGKTLTVTAPTSVLPGSTLVVTALLVDKYGNPVQTDNENPASATATSSLKVVYTGPGLQVGTTPTHTDADGAAKLSYFLGANDSGTAKVTFSYDQNGDGDYTDTTDIVVTKDIIIGAAPVAPAAAKLTVGSFKGFLAIYASGYEGKKLSYKVAGKWGSVASLKAFERVVRKTGAGYTVKVDLYVDGSLVKSETVTTK